MINKIRIYVIAFCKSCSSCKSCLMSAIGIVLPIIDAFAIFMP